MLLHVLQLILIMEDDIVNMLHRKGVTHLIEEIFSYLDYGDIKSATQVSRNWRDLLLTNSRVWKSLWDRNIAHLPTWNLLYERAVCLQTIPEWNPQEACKVVGDSYEKVLLNVQEGIYTEKVDTNIFSNLVEVGSKKVVTSGTCLDEINIQNRWRFNEKKTLLIKAKRILQMEIHEPYLFVVAYMDIMPQMNYSVNVFDLDKNNLMVHEFIVQDGIDTSIFNDVKLKCNDKFLFTCCGLRLEDGGFGYETVLTMRQMPCSAHPENDFPVIDELIIQSGMYPDSIFLEDKRIVIYYGNGTVLILSMDPLRLFRQHKFNVCGAKYWNGWLMESKPTFSDKEDSTQIALTNLDTEEKIAIDIKHLNFNIVNNHLVTLSKSDLCSFKFDVFKLPRIVDSNDLHLLCSYQLHNVKQNWAWYKWKVRFDGVQLWFSIFTYDEAMLAVRDYTR